MTVALLLTIFGLVLTADDMLDEVEQVRSNIAAARSSGAPKPTCWDDALVLPQNDKADEEGGVEMDHIANWLKTGNPNTSVRRPQTIRRCLRRRPSE